LKLKFASILLLVGFLVAPACDRYRVPKGYPKPEEMADILADIHLVESTVTFMPGQPSSRNSEMSGNFKYVLVKHGITPAEFDTIRKWYVDQPELYQRVYDLVLERLSQLDADVRIQYEREKEMKAEAEKLAIQEKLQNLWQDSTFLSVASSDTMKLGYPFRIAVDTLKLQGDVKLMARYQFLRNDESRSPRMMLSAFYNDSVADTVFQSVKLTFQEQTEELLLVLKKDTFPQFIDGYLLLTDSLHASSAKISNIRIKVLADSTRVNPPSEKMPESAGMQTPVEVHEK
jgi:hypothetical protein